MMRPAGGGQETTLIWSGQPRLLTTVAVITVIIMSNNEYPFSWLIYIIKMDIHRVAIYIIYAIMKIASYNIANKLTSWLSFTLQIKFSYYLANYRIVAVRNQWLA